jgi:antitoxin component of RelBE/YafQ-DinJ toxin-antitoxin module
MAEQPQSVEFLTPQECIEVDKALLSSREKFSARLAIYALRVLKQISQQTDLSVEVVTPQQVSEWIAKDETIQQQIDVDANFAGFFTNLVLSSLKPLKQIALETGMPVELLTVSQVIAWFEKEAKIRLEQGDTATFLK